jgi:flagellar hook-associated protein 2
VAITLSGLVSGVDYSLMIDKVVEVERQPANALAVRKSAAQSRLTALGGLVTRLKILQSRAKELDTASEVRAYKVSCSDPGNLTVTSSAAAAPGSHRVRVTQLASAQTSRSALLASADPGAAGAGAIDITVGGDAPITVSWGAGDSLDDLAARINASGARVTAAAVHDGAGWRLVVSGRDGGAANAVSFIESGSPLGLTEVAPAQDAAFTVDGVGFTRGTNTIGDALPGLGFQLLQPTAAGAPDMVVEVARDPAATRQKLQGLVDAYNDVVKGLQGQLAYTGAKKGDDTLFGDPTLHMLQRRLGGVIAAAYPHGASTTSTAALGISLSRDGTLSLDAAKVEAALAKDPTTIESLLAGGAGSLGAALSSLVDDFTAPGTGVLTGKDASIRAQIKAIDARIAKVEDHAANLGERLRAQFAALEQAMAAANDASTYLSSLLYQQTSR